MAKSLSYKEMMNLKRQLLPEDIAQYAVMDSNDSDNVKYLAIVNLINKCIDDVEKYEKK